MTSRSDVQLTLDGREEPLTGPLPAVDGFGKGDVLPLFDTGAFAPRVAGTIAMRQCGRCGALVHPMADRGESCCGGTPY